MRLVCLCIILCLSCFGIEAQIFKKKQTVMILEKFDNCPEYNNYTSEIRNFNSKIDQGNVIMNYETHVLKDSRGLLEFVWEIQRCSNRENLNSCSMFNKMRTNKFCNIIESTGDAWSPFMACVKPRMTCPLKKGVYAGKNCTIDAAAFKIIPLAGAYWRFRAKVMERKIITRMCVDLFGYVRDM